MNRRYTLLAASIVAVSALLAPFYGPEIRARAASPSISDLDRSMQTVASAFSVLERNFADPVNSEQVFYRGAIPGMLQTLDPHSNFVDPASYREMQRRQHAQYFGVGMEITMDGPKVVVMRPFPGSPALNAGMRRGDVIVAVDDKTTIGKDSGAVADMLRGPRGTQVKVSVRREGAAQSVSAVVTRGEIETTVVDAFWVKPGIAFLHLDSFEAQNISRNIEALLGSMGEQSIHGLILDLRGNPGGLVNEAVALAGRFLRNGQTVVSHRGRAEEEQVFRARANALAQRYPIVVMVDRQSASASEIVSGALQDHDRAWILGETTFGKGLVQAQFPLREGAALLLTIAHYYTPSGRLIQRDYQHQSFWSYISGHQAATPSQEPQDVKATDSGRKVFGGGGISPDEKYPGQRLNAFQRRLGPVINAPDAFYHFANIYFGADKPQLPAGWQPDDKTMERFHEFLKSQQVSFADAEFAANRDWMRGRLRWEFYFRVFDRPTADRARWLDDPEMQKAIDSLPKADALLQGVQRVMARRERNAE
jgi:carboxyl-terminal processing protease